MINEFRHGLTHKTENKTFSQLTNEIQDFEEEVKKLTKITKYLFHKVPITHSTNSIHQKSEEFDEQLLGDSLAREGEFEIELIIDFEDIENFKEKLSNFYKSNLGKFTDSEDGSVELIKVKGKLLELVKETEKLEKVNSLMHEILRKAKEKASEKLLLVERRRLEGDTYIQTNSNYSKDLVNLKSNDSINKEKKFLSFQEIKESLDSINMKI